MNTGALAEDPTRDERNLDTIPELEAAMAADAHLFKDDPLALAKEGDGNDIEAAGDDGGEERPTEPTRDEKGKFRSAKESDRAGQDQAGKDAGKPEGSTTEETDPKAADQANNNDKGKQSSAWEKDRQRRDTSWKALNDEKSSFQREREQFEMERQQFKAQQETLSSQRTDEHGFTAAQYQTNAARFSDLANTRQQQAAEAERNGDFGRAEKLMAEAQQNANLGRLAGERAAALRGGGVADVWSALGQDLPEVRQHGSELNQAVIKALKGNPALMRDPMGPLRAAVQVGRATLLQQAEALKKANESAGKVPGLEKQVADLSAQLQELKAKTQLGGGRANLNRGGSDDDFENWPLEKQENWLRSNAR